MNFSCTRTYRYVLFGRKSKTIGPACDIGIFCLPLLDLTMYFLNFYPVVSEHSVYVVKEKEYEVGGWRGELAVFITSPITSNPWGTANDGLLRLLFLLRNDSRPLAPSVSPRLPYSVKLCLSTDLTRTEYSEIRTSPDSSVEKSR